MDALTTTVTMFVCLFALLIIGLLADPSSRDYRS